MMTHTISIAKAEQTYTIDFAALPPASQEFIINYGLRQYMNDGVAGDKTKADATKSADARHEKLLAGTVGIRAVVERNPVRAEAKREVLRALKTKGIKADTVDNLESIIAAHAAKHAERLQKIVDLRNDDSGVDLEIA